MKERSVGLVVQTVGHIKLNELPQLQREITYVLVGEETGYRQRGYHHGRHNILDLLSAQLVCLRREGRYVLHQGDFPAIDHDMITDKVGDQEERGSIF